MNQIGKETVTQQMIAEAAKVNVSTVSLALRNDARLPEATRLRIQSLARRLGYSPNPLISLLMARVRRRNASYRGTLAYVHTLPQGAPRLREHVHRNFLAGARQRAAELGYKLDEFFMSPDTAHGRRLATMLRARNISGVVLEHSPSPSCPDRRLSFDMGDFAMATLGVPLSEPPLHYVANDQYMRPILAARELLALGYRRLGMIVDVRFDSKMAHRCSAGFWAVQQYIDGLAEIPICTQPNEPRSLNAWLKRHRPDAILSSEANTLSLLAALGLRVPEDIGWVHLDWLPEFKPAAGVYGNSENTGAAAVELVVSQMHRGEAGPPARPVNYLVTGSWVPGKSVRKVGPRLDLDSSFFADLARA